MSLAGLNDSDIEMMPIRFNFALVVTLTLAFALVGSFLFIGHSVRADFDVADSAHMGFMKAYSRQATNHAVHHLR